MRHVISALVRNEPGVLAHITGMLASRGFNIDSLTAGTSERPDQTRLTLVLVGDDSVIDQIRLQLAKIPYTISVEDLSRDKFVERELMLVRVKCLPEKRAEIALLAENFRGRLLDIRHDEVMAEVGGSEWKVASFLELMRPYGVIAVARTGLIALPRGESETESPSPQQDHDL